MTDDLKIDKTRRDSASVLTQKRADYKASKHTIADIHFTEPTYVVCSCGWRADGETEESWRAHKHQKKERSF